MIRGDAAEEALLVRADALVRARGIESDADLGPLFDAPPGDGPTAQSLARAGHGRRHRNRRRHGAPLRRDRRSTPARAGDTPVASRRAPAVSAQRARPGWHPPARTSQRRIDPALPVGLAGALRGAADARS